jgi:hypothetical protein
VIYMSVVSELQRFRGMKGAMTREEEVRERRLFSAIGTTTRPVSRTKVLPAGRYRARRGVREDVLLELEQYHGGPRRASTARDKDMAYDYFAAEGFFGRLLGRKEATTEDEARRQVADLRVAIGRTREELARANTRIAGEERKITDAEAKIREAEQKIARLERAFALERTDRRLAVTITRV